MLTTRRRRAHRRMLPAHFARTATRAGAAHVRPASLAPRRVLARRTCGPLRSHRDARWRGARAARFARTATRAGAAQARPTSLTPRRALARRTCGLRLAVGRGAAATARRRGIRTCALRSRGPQCRRAGARVAVLAPVSDWWRPSSNAAAGSLDHELVANDHRAAVGPPARALVQLARRTSKGGYAWPRLRASTARRSLISVASRLLGSWARPRVRRHNRARRRSRSCRAVA